ncbi:MAG: AAA family ATPase [Pseudomonadota bacterium]
MSHAFIAHAEDQLDALLKLSEHLRKAGIPSSFVPHDEPDRSRSDRAINDATFMIALVSYEAMKSKTVRADIERARKNGLNILPVRADRTRVGGFVKSELGKDLTLSTDDMAGVIEAAKKAYRAGCPVVAVMNMKGGVGKTTVTAQLAGALQKASGNRVLLIDLDPQYNLSQLFFPAGDADEAAAKDASVISLFEKSKLHEPARTSPADRWGQLYLEPFTPAPREAISHSLIKNDQTRGRLDMIFGQFEISKYAFSTDRDGLETVREHFLRTLDFYRGLYDLVILDTNPNATFLTRCALQAADRVLAPMHTDVYSLRGIKLLNRVITDQTDTDHRPELSVLFNSVERREQSDFEADTRNGAFNEQVGFDLSAKLMTAVLPRSRHFQVRVDEEEPPEKRLLTLHGRGGGLRHVRQALDTVASELQGVLKIKAERVRTTA